MSSSRLPGKSLADIGGEPALALLLRRLRRARVSTRSSSRPSTDQIDDAIAEVAAEIGVAVGAGHATTCSRASWA